MLGVGTSLDGYIARRDGTLDFLFMPSDYSMGSVMSSIDVQMMGRKTYEVSLKLGANYGATETYVFSRTAPSGRRDGVIFTDEAPQRVVDQVRSRKGNNIWLAGGGELTREFLKADLIDEIYLGIVPVLVGEGVPSFPPVFPQRNFELIENKTYSEGMIALKYRRLGRV